MSGLQLGYEKIQQYGQELGLSETVIESAEDLCEEIELQSSINRSPSALAAASLYWVALMHNEKVTQKEVASVTDVATQTIRNAYHEIAEREGIDLSHESNSEGTNDRAGMLARVRAVVWGEAAE